MCWHSTAASGVHASHTTGTTTHPGAEQRPRDGVPLVCSKPEPGRPAGDSPKREDGEGPVRVVPRPGHAHLVPWGPTAAHHGHATPVSLDVFVLRPRGTLPGGACPPPRGAGWATRQGEAGCSVCSVLPAADEFMGACASMGRRGARPRAEGRQRAPTPKVVGEDVPHPFLVWVRHVPVFRDSNPVVENEVPAAALPIQPQRQTDQDRRAYPKRQRRQQRKLRALHTGMRRREHTADENHLLWFYGATLTLTLINEVACLQPPRASWPGSIRARCRAPGLGSAR